MLIPADEAAFAMLSRAGVNELTVVNADGQQALQVSDGCQLVIVSPAWMSEMIGAQVELARRVEQAQQAESR